MMIFGVYEKRAKRVMMIGEEIRNGAGRKEEEGLRRS